MATLYFNSQAATGAGDGNGANIVNYFTDSAWTVPAVALPANGDNLYIDGDTLVVPPPGSPVTLNNLYLGTISSAEIADIEFGDSVVVGGNLVLGNTATSQSGYWADTSYTQIEGNVDIYASSQILGNFTSYQNIIFHDASTLDNEEYTPSLYASINGVNVTFNDSSVIGLFSHVSATNIKLAVGVTLNNDYDSSGSYEYGEGYYFAPALSGNIWLTWLTGDSNGIINVTSSTPLTQSYVNNGFTYSTIPSGTIYDSAGNAITKAVVTNANTSYVGGTCGQVIPLYFEGVVDYSVSFPLTATFDGNCTGIGIGTVGQAISGYIYLSPGATANFGNSFDGGNGLNGTFSVTTSSVNDVAGMNYENGYNTSNPGGTNVYDVTYVPPPALTLGNLL